MGQIYLGNIPIVGNKNSSSSENFINDEGAYPDKVYSSKKTEKRLEEVQNSLIAGQESMVNLWQKNSLSVKANDTITFTTADNGNISKVIVQCFKFVPGEKNTTQIIKNFNNGEEENFYHSECMEFNGVARIRNHYEYKNILNNDGLYESQVINLKEYVDLHRIEVV